MRFEASLGYRVGVCWRRRKKEEKEEGKDREELCGGRGKWEEEHTASSAAQELFVGEGGLLALKQWFSPFLTLQPFNTAPHFIMIPNHTIIFLTTSSL